MKERENSTIDGVGSPFHKVMGRQGVNKDEGVRQHGRRE